jgi:choline dehydrogenase-like flavoprotein
VAPPAVSDNGRFSRALVRRVVIGEMHEISGDWDAIVIGSGFGATMTAYELVRHGWSVLMLERGDWIRRSRRNWTSDGFCFRSEAYSLETPYRAVSGGYRARVGSIQCVGGPSVFYGGVSMRYRHEDFSPGVEIVGDSGARWPFGYDRLERRYVEAERLLSVSGEPGDPTEPHRSTPHPFPPAALAPTSRMIWDAAEGLGMHPFRLPLAINHRRANGLNPCVACTTCDGFACAIRAKNDLATAVLPSLQRDGLVLEPNQVVNRLVHDGSRVTAVESIDRLSGRRQRFSSDVVVLAAGALASPHLVLASGLHAVNPAGDVVGRFLVRHWNAAVLGAFVRKPNPAERFHKQVAVHDLYFGHAELGKLGGIQQISAPPAAALSTTAGRGAGALSAPLLTHMTGLLVIAEDQPQYENRVWIDATRRDPYGLPELCIRHAYSRRDAVAGATLVSAAKTILRRAGAGATHVHKIRTFSHALGTLRMGVDVSTSVLDENCRFRGLENLYVTDGSALPTAAAVNPSLTIAANALRVGAHLAGVESGCDVEMELHAHAA